MKRISRRPLLKLAVPAGLSVLFVPAWLRSGGHRLPPLVGTIDQAQAPSPTIATTASATPSGLPANAKAGPPGPNRNVLVGGLESVQGNVLMVLDAEGLHTVTLSPSTMIEKAVGDPTYARVRNADASRLKVGDALFVSGQHQANDAIAAANVSVNVMLGGSAIGDTLGADAQGHRYIDARRQVSMQSREFDAAHTLLWVSPDADVKKLGPDGKFVTAQLQQFNPAQHIGFQALKADDGSIVVVTLLLGNGKPPGVP